MRRGTDFQSLLFSAPGVICGPRPLLGGPGRHAVQGARGWKWARDGAAVTHGGLGLLIVNVAPVDAERGTGGSFQVALEVQKGSGWSRSHLAGLIAVGPFVGEQLGGLGGVPA